MESYVISNVVIYSNLHVKKITIDESNPDMRLSSKQTFCMKITIDKSNPDVRLSSQQTFCVSPDVLTRASNTPVMTMALVFDQGLQLKHCPTVEAKSACSHCKLLRFVPLPCNNF